MSADHVYDYIPIADGFICQTIEPLASDEVSQDYVLSQTAPILEIDLP